MEKLISKLIENEIIYVVKASKIEHILDFFPTQIFYQCPSKLNYQKRRISMTNYAQVYIFLCSPNKKKWIEQKKCG